MRIGASCTGRRSACQPRSSDARRTARCGAESSIAAGLLERLRLLRGGARQLAGCGHLAAQPFGGDVEAVGPGRCAEFEEDASEIGFLVQGSSIGPGSATMLVKSCTPSLPSLKCTRRRKPPSLSRRITLVSIQTCSWFHLGCRHNSPGARIRMGVGQADGGPVCSMKKPGPVVEDACRVEAQAVLLQDRVDEGSEEFCVQ